MFNYLAFENFLVLVLADVKYKNSKTSNIINTFIYAITTLNLIVVTYLFKIIITNIFKYLMTARSKNAGFLGLISIYYAIEELNS